MRTPHHQPGVLMIASTGEVIVLPPYSFAIDYVIELPLIDRIGDQIAEVPSPRPILPTQINLN